MKMRERGSRRRSKGVVESHQTVRLITVEVMSRRVNPMANLRMMRREDDRLEN